MLASNRQESCRNCPVTTVQYYMTKLWNLDTNLVSRFFRTTARSNNFWGSSTSFLDSYHHAKRSQTLAVILANKQSLPSLNVSARLFLLYQNRVLMDNCLETGWIYLSQLNFVYHLVVNSVKMIIDMCINVFKYWHPATALSGPALFPIKGGLNLYIILDNIKDLI